MESNPENKQMIECLNRILEHELAGVVRYSHYAFMIFGHNRIPICKWLRDQARESLDHADQVGEIITALGGHPSLKIGSLLETHKHSVNDILNEGLAHETQQLSLYGELMGIAKDRSLFVEEFARKMICEEEAHTAEVKKMLKQPG